MKRYIGGVLLVVAVVATMQNMDKPEMSGAVGFIWLVLGIPGAILLFRKAPKS